MQSLSQKTPHSFFKLLVFALILIIFSCAKHPRNIRALAYSHQIFANDSCKQIEQKLAKTHNEVMNYSYKQKMILNSQTGIIFIFWPSIFALPASVSYEMEIAELKGQLFALRQAGKIKHCNTF